MDGGGSGDDAGMCPRGHWRLSEDEKLRQLVEQYGPQNWTSIAEKLQGRSGMYMYMCAYCFRNLESELYLIVLVFTINFAEQF